MGKGESENEYAGGRKGKNGAAAARRGGSGDTGEWIHLGGQRGLLWKLTCRDPPGALVFSLLGEARAVF